MSGSPSIIETIFHKIKHCALVVADVTFVGESLQNGSGQTKRLPNPNVMLKLGYAAALLGWDRIILVLNKHYGSPDSLPFDLKFRRFPITYRLGPELKNRQIALDSLLDSLEFAIRACLAAPHQQAEDIISKFSTYTRQLMEEHHLSESFHETENLNTILARHDLAITQMLDNNLIRCLRSGTLSKLVYYWTYLGKRCMVQMGLSILPDTISESVEISNSVPLIFHGYKIEE